MNDKRVDRLYRLEGIAGNCRKRKRLSVSRGPRLIAAGSDHSFVSNRLTSVLRFRCLTLIDSYTREWLAFIVAHSMPSTAVIATLEAVIAGRGSPERLSRDNRGEFHSRTFDDWAADCDVALSLIPLREPVPNAHVVGCNRECRDECLDQHWLLSLLHAPFHIQRPRRYLNTARKHEARTP